MKIYKVLDKYDADIPESNQVHYWTLEDILHEINRDRSEEWTDYDRTDWKEGLEEWTNCEILEVIEQ